MFNTRIAPSPTGDMHIGTARTAYFNWLAARATGGKFTLRIDDTDQKRNDPAYLKVILDSMDWLGLDYDQIVYQSQRFDYYRDVAENLVFQNKAIYKDGAIILSLPVDYGYPKTWHDEVIGDINISTNDHENINNSVLIKSDGSPSYNFCTVIDDLHFGINFIIRGVDHITNTPKQIVLFNELKHMGISDSQDLPKFAHVGLICVKNKPLSKRDGAASMLHYMNAGYDADAMLNFLARMGWGPNVDNKTTVMLPRERMVEMFFDQGHLNGGSSGFDVNKLESFDRKYKAKKGIWRNRDKLS